MISFLEQQVTQAEVLRWLLDLGHCRDTLHTVHMAGEGSGGLKTLVSVFPRPFSKSAPAL